MTPQVTVVGVWNNDKGYYKDEWFDEAVNGIEGQTLQEFLWETVFFGESMSDEQVKATYDGLYDAHHRPDLNYTEARCAAMDLVTTPWACVMDFDDTYEPTLIEKKLAYAKEHPDAVMISSWFRFMDAEGKLLPQVTDGKRISERIREQPNIPPMAHPGIFIRMDAYRKSGGYNPKVFRGEDWDLWPRIAEHGDWAVIPEFLWTYRRHDQQMVKRPYTGGKS